MRSASHSDEDHRLVKLFSGGRELVLELGIGGVGLCILGGLAILVVGRLSGDAQRGGRRAEGPPSAGSVPPERHQNLSSSPR
jgi:hypothetical protein